MDYIHTIELREQWLDILHVMESLDVDLYGLAETNINWNPSVTNFLYQQLWYNVTKGKRQIKMVSAACDDPASTLYQPGGVSQISLGTLSGRIGHTGIDPHDLGRWVYMTLQGKESRKMVIVTVYRVPQAHPPPGYRTVYNQKARAL